MQFRGSTDASASDLTSLRSFVPDLFQYRSTEIETTTVGTNLERIANALEEIVRIERWRDYERIVSNEFNKK